MTAAHPHTPYLGQCPPPGEFAINESDVRMPLPPHGMSFRESFDLSSGDRVLKKGIS